MTTMTLPQRTALARRQRPAPSAAHTVLDPIEVPSTPDHVPPDLEAEHADAAEVVAGHRQRARRRWAGVASHDPRRPSPIRAAVGALLGVAFAVTAANLDAAPLAGAPTVPAPRATPAVDAAVEAPTGAGSATAPTTATAGTVPCPASALERNPFRAPIPVGCDAAPRSDAAAASDAAARAERGDPVLWRIVELVKERSAQP